MKSKLQLRFVLYACLTALIPLTISYLVFVKDRLDDVTYSIEQQLYSVATLVASDLNVQRTLLERRNDFSLQIYATNLIRTLDSVDIIVITDMEEMKYSHLDIRQVNDRFLNEDKRRVLDEGVGYYSLKLGSMGLTYRRFEPIFFQGEQVGFVMVGKYQSRIVTTRNQLALKYGILFVGSVLFAYLFGTYSARNIRKSLLHMEPEDISRLYLEKKALISSVQYGVIAFDVDMNVIEVNQTFFNLVGKFDSSHLSSEVKKLKEQYSQVDMKEVVFCSKKLLLSMVPIVDQSQEIGTLILLQEYSRVKEIANAITNVNQVNSSLRATIHEYKNQLHVILGLIEIQDYQKAKSYIRQVQHVKEEGSMALSSIHDSCVTAILQGKMLRCKEQQIELWINPKSNLNHDHGIIESYELVSLLGHLIENAIESATESLNQRVVKVYMKETESEIVIEVMDSGPKIEESYRKYLYDQGFSTKGDHRGFGLSEVKDKVRLYHGSIEYVEKTVGKSFKVRLKKEC